MSKSNHQIAIERLENIHSALSNWKVALGYMLGNMKKSIDEYKTIVQELDFEKVPEDKLR